MLNPFLSSRAKYGKDKPCQNQLPCSKKYKNKVNCFLDQQQTEDCSIRDFECEYCGEKECQFTSYHTTLAPFLMSLSQSRKGAKEVQFMIMKVFIG